MGEKQDSESAHPSHIFRLGTCLNTHPTANLLRGKRPPGAALPPVTDSFCPQQHCSFLDASAPVRSVSLVTRQETAMCIQAYLRTRETREWNAFVWGFDLASRSHALSVW